MTFTKSLIAASLLLVLLAMAMSIATASSKLVGAAIDHSHSEQDAVVAKHKAYLAGDDDYYISEDDFRAANQHANKVLAKAYGRDK